MAATICLSHNISCLLKVFRAHTRCWPEQWNIYSPVVFIGTSYCLLYHRASILMSFSKSSPQQTLCQRERECKLVNTSLGRPASWYSLQGNHSPLLAGALWLIAHTSFEFKRCSSVSIVLSGGGWVSRAVATAWPTNRGRSNQIIINLLITDCQQHERGSPLFLSPQVENVGFRGRAS